MMVRPVSFLARKLSQCHVPRETMDIKPSPWEARAGPFCHPIEDYLRRVPVGNVPGSKVQVRKKADQEAAIIIITWSPSYTFTIFWGSYQKFAVCLKIRGAQKWFTSLWLQKLEFPPMELKRGRSGKEDSEGPALCSHASLSATKLAPRFWGEKHSDLEKRES